MKAAPFTKFKSFWNFFIFRFSVRRIANLWKILKEEGLWFAIYFLKVFYSCFKSYEAHCIFFLPSNCNAFIKALLRYCTFCDVFGVKFTRFFCFISFLTFLNVHFSKIFFIRFSYIDCHDFLPLVHFMGVLYTFSSGDWFFFFHLNIYFCVFCILCRF